MDEEELDFNSNINKMLKSIRKILTLVTHYDDFSADGAHEWPYSLPGSWLDHKGLISVVRAHERTKWIIEGALGQSSSTTRHTETFGKKKKKSNEQGQDLIIRFLSNEQGQDLIRFLSKRLHHQIPKQRTVTRPHHQIPK